MISIRRKTVPRESATGVRDTPACRRYSVTVSQNHLDRVDPFQTGHHVLTAASVLSHEKPALPDHRPGNPSLIRPFGAMIDRLSLHLPPTLDNAPTLNSPSKVRDS